jgi:hypothetical protein
MNDIQRLADNLAAESHFIDGCVQAAKPQHTPMEWAYDEDAARIYYDDGDVQPTIAYVERDGVAPEQVKADGYLLAASRSMYDKLLDIKSLAESGDDNGYDPYALLDLVAQEARAAIAKAHRRRTMSTSNQNRSDRAESSLRQYVEAKGEVFTSSSSEIADLITDLLHLTVRLDEGDDPVESTLRLAKMHFDAEHGNPEEETV